MSKSDSGATLFRAKPYRYLKKPELAPTFVPKTWKIKGWYNSGSTNKKWNPTFMHPRPFITYDKSPFLKRSITPPWPKLYKEPNNKVRPPKQPPSRKWKWETTVTNEINKKVPKAEHVLVNKDRKRDPWGRKYKEEEGEVPKWKKSARLQEIMEETKEDMARKAAEDARKQAEILAKKQWSRPVGGRQPLKKNVPTAKCVTALSSREKVEFAIPDSYDPSQAMHSKGDIGRKETALTQASRTSIRSKNSTLYSSMSEAPPTRRYSHPAGTVLKLTPKISPAEDQQRKMHNLRRGRPCEQKLYVDVEDQRHFARKPTPKLIDVKEKKFEETPKPLRKHIRRSLLDNPSEASMERLKEAQKEEERRRRREMRERRHMKGPDQAAMDRLATPKHQREKLEERKGSTAKTRTRLPPVQEASQKKNQKEFKEMQAELKKKEEERMKEERKEARKRNKQEGQSKNAADSTSSQSLAETLTTQRSGRQNVNRSNAVQISSHSSPLLRLLSTQNSTSSMNQGSKYAHVIGGSNVYLPPIETTTERGRTRTRRVAVTAAASTKEIEMAPRIVVPRPEFGARADGGRYLL